MPDGTTISVRSKTKERSSGTIVVMTVLLVGALCIAGWFYHRSILEQAEQNANSATAVVSVLHLDSFVVNLAGDDGTGYLRMGVDLGLGIEIKDGGARSPYIGELRDTILTVLGSRTVQELLTPEGKAKLRSDMLQAIQERVPEIHCHEVYYTEFLVQR